MKKLKFNVSIDAPKEKVWDILWADKSYREWTSVFSEGSYAKSDWKEGSRIEFLDGKGNGMYSVIEKKIPNAEMSFRHLGDLKDGVENPANWGDAREKYFLEESNGKTELKTELDITEEYEPYFADIFPKALEKVKQLAEK